MPFSQLGVEKLFHEYYTEGVYYRSCCVTALYTDVLLLIYAQATIVPLSASAQCNYVLCRVVSCHVMLCYVRCFPVCRFVILKVTYPPSLPLSLT